MGMSGMLGKVYYIDKSCPAYNCDTGWAAPGGNATCWVDEVTRFTVVDSVNRREYGHDKSQGWQDVVAGIRRFGITLDAVLREQVAQPIGAGHVLYLQLYPLGKTCDDDPIEGYAMVEQVSYTHDEERGEPISYTITAASKGPWTGLDDGQSWGGFECGCGDSGSGQ